MEGVFLKVLNMAVNASWLILAVVVLRLLLRRSPRWIFCLMWALVAFRLICPLTLKGALSLIPSAEPIPQDIAMMGTPSIDSGIQAVDHVVNPVVQEYFTPDPATSMNPLQGVVFLASAVWLLGIALMLIYAAVSYYRVCKKVRVSMPLEEHRVFACDGIRTPFILGVFRPAVYVPSDLSEERLDYVLAHERAHLKRKDHWWKPLGFLILSVYWFHPLCWLSYILFCRDLELCTDESVIKEKSLAYRKSYSEALLACSVPGRKSVACPLAFGEVGVKARIKSVLNYRKPAFWMILAAIAALLAVVFCFLSDPSEDTREEDQGTSTEGTPQETEASQNAELPGETAEENLTPEEEKILLSTLREWARAFCERDGNTIAAMSSPEVRGELSSEETGEILMGSEGQYSFGWSSPWPWFVEDSSIRAYDASSAEIYYYALVSDPHVTCWKETLNYEWDGERYVITGESLEFYDQISSGAEYDSAYAGGLGGTPMDYEKNGHGEALNENALLSSSDWYRDLFEPESAAIMLLNLDEEAVEVTRLQEESTGLVGLSITFTEDQAERIISMYQPYGEIGIWIPADYRVDVMSRFLKIEWDDRITGLPFTENPDFSGIVCLGELPEYGIRVYGYNDEEVQGRGVAIDINGDVNYFDWEYMTPRAVLPELYWNEEKRQLQIAFHTYAGTGIDAEELYVLQQFDTGTLEPGRLTMADYGTSVAKRIGWSADENTNGLTLIDYDTDQAFFRTTASGHVTDVDFVSVSEFELGDTITFRFRPGYAVDGGVIYEYEDMPVIEMEVLVNDPGENGSVSLELGEEMKVVR